MVTFVGTPGTCVEEQRLELRKTNTGDWTLEHSLINVLSG